MLTVGIVGLPNVGKSTLFNALTKSRKAEMANYPFCTIDPNVGVVEVPDERLEPLAKLSGSEKILPAVIQFVDIAGLVKGASAGEGLGNKFLSHIREVNAIIHMVRCFENNNIHHVSGVPDPLRDIEVIETELILADIESLGKQKRRLEKLAKSGDKEAKKTLEILLALEKHLEEGKTAISFKLDSPDEQKILNSFFLLSSKPTLYACNLSENIKDIENELVNKVSDYANKTGGKVVPICAQMEQEFVELSDDEINEFIELSGRNKSGVSELIRTAYSLLNLQTYFTSGEKETRSWTIKVGDKAPASAGVIHTDFERGFIAAEVIFWEELVKIGSRTKAKEQGKLRIEGKDYVVKDGDVVEFRFNV